MARAGSCARSAAGRLRTQEACQQPADGLAETTTLPPSNLRNNPEEVCPVCQDPLLRDFPGCIAGIIGLFNSPGNL